MACERIKKLLNDEMSDSSCSGSSKNEESKMASTGIRKTSTPPASLNEFQKKIISYYENNLNKDCSFKEMQHLNPHIEKLDEDILYHIALGNKSHDLSKMFKDVKFVVMGGTPKRMEYFAYYIMNEIGYELPPGTILNDISKHSHRYAMYKVGPVLSVSHGMGMPSIGILLHELIKLVHHAGIKDPVFVRIGTSGGFSQKGGTVVVTDVVVNDYLESIYELSILGANVQFPAILNQNLAAEITALADPNDNFKTIKGKTYCTDSFYDGSGRADGAVCEFSEAQGMEYYELLKKNGVANVEMESLAFAALTCRAGIKSAVIDVVLSDRLETDQIKQPKEVLDEWQTRPQKLLARYIKKVLSASGAAKTSTESAPTASTPVAPPAAGKIICPALSCGKSAGSSSTTIQPSVPQPASCAQKAAATASTPTASRIIECPPLSCGRPPTSAPSSQPTTAEAGKTRSTDVTRPESSSCKPLCEKRPISGIGSGTATTSSNKVTSATDSVKDNFASAKPAGSAWRSCYKTCGIGSEWADVGTPRADQPQTTAKPSTSAGAKSSGSTPASFNCECLGTKVAKPSQTPAVPKPTAAPEAAKKCGGCLTSTSNASAAATTPAYQAKDFDSSTMSSDPNESRNAYYKHCVKLPRCDQPAGAQKKASYTMATPVLEKTKAGAAAKAGETRPCCLGRSDDARGARTPSYQQNYVEDCLDQESKTSSCKGPSQVGKRLSTSKAFDDMELGPCCSEKATLPEPKNVTQTDVGPCCAGKKEEGSPPECTDRGFVNSETFDDKRSSKAEETSIRSETPSVDSTQPKGSIMPSDCPLVLKARCDPGAYADAVSRAAAAGKVVDPSPETPDPRQGTKGPVFTTTPKPGSNADPTTTVPAFYTPTAAGRPSDGSCCIRSAAKNSAPKKRTSTTSGSSLGSCCLPASGQSAGGASAASRSSSVAAAPAATSGGSCSAPGRATEANKYDESPSPCAACKKFQDSKIIFTGGTPSVSQPTIIKCPHKLKRLKEECRGYD